MRINYLLSVLVNRIIIFKLLLYIINNNFFQVNTSSMNINSLLSTELIRKTSTSLFFGTRLRDPMDSITQPVPVRESFPFHVKITAEPGPESTFKRLQMTSEMLKMETIISR